MTCSNYYTLLASYALLLVSANGATLVEHLAATSDLSQLSSTINTASYDLLDTWNQNGPFTVFAPSNSAFTAVQTKVNALTQSSSAMKSLVNGHIVRGAYSAAMLTNGLVLETVSGQKLTVYNTGSQIYIENMLVKSADTTVTKGGLTSYVHTMDAVNFPPSSRNILQSVQAVPSTYSSLASTAVTAAITNVLESGSYTLFAPTDTAFAAASALTSLYSTSSELGDILKYHLVKGIIDTSSLANNSKLPTVQGGELSVMKNSAGQVFINQGLISGVTSCTNGRMYQIDSVLVPTGTDDKKYRDIISSLASEPATFTILPGAISTASLTGTFTQSTKIASANYTMFAPIDSAWAAAGYPIPATGAQTYPSAVADYVKTATVSGLYKASDLSNGQSLTTLEGGALEVYISGVDVYIANAKVVKTDVTASNGIIHYIDSLIIPRNERNTVQVLQAYPASYSTLIAAISAAGLTSTIAGLGATTFMAPTNAAFAEYPTRVNELLNKASYGDTTPLQTLLKYHVIGSGALSSSTLFGSASSTYATLQSDDIIFTREGISSAYTYYADSATVNPTVSDIPTKNSGYVHQVDGMLFPKSMRTIYQFLASDRNAYSSLKKAVDLAGLKATLESGSLTLLGWTEATLANSNPTKILVTGLIADAEKEGSSGGPATEKLKMFLNYATLNNAQQFGGDGSYGLTSGAVRRNLCPTAGSPGECGPNGLFVEVYFESGTTPAETRVDNLPLVLTGQKDAINGYLQVFQNGVLVPPLYQNLYEALRARPTTFATLLSHIAATSFDSNLVSTADEYTFFTPTDAAFVTANSVGSPLSSISTADLRKILQYHLVRGKLDSATLSAQYKAQAAKGLKYTLDSVFGSTLEVYEDSRGDLFVNNMKIDKSNMDIAASNGIFHYTNDVAIQPPIRNALQQIQASPATYSTLLSALTAGGLNNYVATQTHTIFAPTNAAFNAVMGQVTGYLTASTTTNLVNLLNYHIFPNAKLTANDAFNSPSLIMKQGDTANVVTKNDVIYVDIAPIDKATQFSATNAQVHEIPSVLFPPALRNVAEVVMANTPTYYTLGIALQKAGLVPTLSTSARYTLLAADDAAFADASVSSIVTSLLNAENPAGLRKFLSYHVIEGDITAAALQNTENTVLTTMGGDKVSVKYENNVIMINDAVVTPAATADGTNGYIHKISNVLLPPDMRTIFGVVKSEPVSYSTIEQYITAAGLTATLNGADEYTLFAPTNTAIAAYSTTLDPLYQLAANGTNKVPLQNFLKYHLVKGKQFSAGLTNTSLVSVLGEVINVMKGTDGKVYINQAPVQTADVSATNGVVHVLGSSMVLWPPSTRNGLMWIEANPGAYSTLLTTLTQCSLDSYFSATTSAFTLFAPSDAAFATYNTVTSTNVASAGCAASKKSLLQYHVATKALDLSSLKSGDVIDTLSEPASSRRAGHSYKLEVWRPESSADIYIDNAKLLVASAAQVSNGYAYQLDAVLVPPDQRNVFQWTQSVPSKFRTLSQLIPYANLTAVLMGTGPFTVFAPTSTAFAALTGGLRSILGSGRSDPALQEVLLNHVVVGQWPTPLKAGTIMRSVSGLAITITEDRTTGKFYANDVELAGPTGISATNGIVYPANGVILSALPIPDTAIPPPSANLVPEGLCPEYAALLSGDKSPGGAKPAPGAAFVTAKLSADKKEMVVSVHLDNPVAQKGDASFGHMVKSINVHGPLVVGETQAPSLFGFSYDYTVCSKDTPPCAPARSLSGKFTVTNQILMDMDKGLFYVEIYNGDNAALRGHLSRQACYEAYLSSGPATSSGYAMVMVNPEETEVLVQMQGKNLIDVSSIRLYGQLSSPNLDQLDPSAQTGAFEWTFFDKDSTEDKSAFAYMRPGFAVTDTMVAAKGLPSGTLKQWVHGFSTGQYYLQAVFPTGSMYGSIFPAMPCPSLTAFGVDKKGYFTSFNTGSDAYLISQARLDSYSRQVLVMVKLIRAPSSDIIGVDVTVGDQNPKVVLSLGKMTGNLVISRFYLTDFDVFNFQQGMMNFVVKTKTHPEGEVRGRYQMSTCYLAEFVPTATADQANTAFAQIQVAQDGTEAFVTVLASNTTNDSGAKPFQEVGTNKEEAALSNVVLPFMNGVKTSTPTLLPGMAPPPVVLQDPSGSKNFPLMHVTFGGGAAEMAEVTSRMVLGQVSLDVAGLAPAALSSVVGIKTVEDPSKYIVEEGDTLASIAEKKGFDSWVPLQMVNRLTTLNLKVGQVLDLCYRHRVMPKETIYGIAQKYGLSLKELYPLNPQLFDKQFIYAGQDVCVMPALKRIMCGYKGQIKVGM